MEELIPIFLFLSVAAVLILRPLTKRLGLLLEAMARAKMGTPSDPAEVAQLRASLEHMTKRLDLAEERLDFTERLVSAGQRNARAARLGGVALDGAAGRGFDGLAEREPDYLSR
jgi:hypothetical protein